MKKNNTFYVLQLKAKRKKTTKARKTRVKKHFKTLITQQHGLCGFDFKLFKTPKTNMTGWKITMLSRRYIDSNGCFVQCHVSFRGCQPSYFGSSLSSKGEHKTKWNTSPPIGTPKQGRPRDLILLPTNERSMCYPNIGVRCIPVVLHTSMQMRIHENYISMAS